MSAAKKKHRTADAHPFGPLPGFVRLMFTRPWRQITLSVMLCALLAGSFFWLWQRAGEEVIQADIYQITPEKIVITPPPNWIHSDIKAEAITSGSLEGKQSLLDDELTERVARAFSLHPWVARVESVRKSHPARIEVMLVYRRPVCMVATGGGLLPIDADGIVLPRADFSPIEASRYPRLEGIHTGPLGPVGTRWGDERVHSGAQLAAALLDDWNDLGLEKIVPSEPNPQGGTQPLAFDLLSSGGSRIHWGSAPDSPLPGEIPAGEKLAHLKKYVAEHGSLEGPSGRPQEIDLRHVQLRIAPRTARSAELQRQDR